jgi:DUF1680 family protein
MRGPVVYCLESADLPEGVRVMDVRLPADATFEVTPLPALGGVRAMRTKVLAGTSGEWKGELYREMAARRDREVGVTFVPYFAWDNRGATEMTVWVPLA